MPEPIETIHRYIVGKDTNRPYLVEQVFTDDSVVRINTTGDAVKLAPMISGRIQIADELSRQFAQTYENIRTYCFGPLPSADALRYDCGWLVGMSVKKDRSLRVGWGWYSWTFDSDQDYRCRALQIDIARMHVLPAESLHAVMTWLDGQDYPWVQAQALADGLPAIRELAELPSWLQSPG